MRADIIPPLPNKITSPASVPHTLDLAVLTNIQDVSYPRRCNTFTLPTDIDPIVTGRNGWTFSYVVV